MTKSNLLFGAAIALAAGMLAGCSKEPAAENQIQTVDHDQVRYLNVTISSPTGMGTRATTDDDDFSQGSEKENFVKSMTFVFYDAAGLPTGQAHELNFEADADGANKESDHFSNTTGNVGKIWQDAVPVQLTQGENMPAYVMCFINPTGTVDFKATSLDGIKEIERQEVVTSEGNFPMTNSVYYGTNPVSGETNVRVFAAPIATDQLFTSREDALKSNAKTTEIYVERYAARIQLNLTPATVAPNTTAVRGYTLTFTPEFWRPNAIDQNTYAVKRFGIHVNGVTDYEPTYADLIKNFSSNWWNDPDKYRSYWGCSPSYYANKYPRVSDDITDKAADNDYTGTGVSAYPYEIHYFNYQQFKEGKLNGGVSFPKAIEWNTTTGFDKVYYARETTTASTAWGYEPVKKEIKDKKEYNPLATIASAVIIGRYTLTKTGADTDLVNVPAEEHPTFYLYGKTYNETTKEEQYNLYFDSNIKAAMIKNQGVILQKSIVSGVETYKAYRPEDGSGYKVEHPSAAVRTIKSTIVAGRLVALQLDTKTMPDNLYYYDATQSNGNEYVKISADNEDSINRANSDLLSAGYATKYFEGIAYFNIPIEHLGIYNENGTDYVEGAKTGGKYNFEKCPAGSFGIVRNHNYTINVTGISGLGTALRDKTQPIVPPVDETTYYISAKVNILNWRIVPAQSVTL